MTEKKQDEHSWKVLAIVAYALFMDYFLYGLIVPLGPHSPAKVTSEHEIGMLFCTYAFGVLVSTPLFGYLGDRLGCRKPMIIGVFLSGLATLLFCFSSHFYWLMIARFCQGAAAAASWTSGLALVAEHYVEKRVQMMGLAMVGSTAGSVLGPLAGGWFYDLGGYTLPFIITGAMVAVDACMRIFLLPPEVPSTEKSPDLKALLLDKSILIAGLAVAVAAAGWGIIEPLLPNHLGADGASPGQVGLIFTVSSIVYGCFAPVVSWASEKFSAKRTICFGIVGMSLCLPLLALAKGIVLAGFCLCLVNASYAFLLNPTSAELGNAVDRRGLDCYAAVYAVYNIAYSLGQMGADSFASSFGEQMSFFQVLSCMSVVLILSIPLILKGVPDAPTVAEAQTE